MGLTLATVGFHSEAQPSCCSLRVHLQRVSSLSLLFQSSSSVLFVYRFVACFVIQTLMFFLKLSWSFLCFGLWPLLLLLLLSTAEKGLAPCSQPTFEIFIYIDEIPSQPSLKEPGPAPAASPYMGDAPEPSSSLWSPLDPFQ